MQLLIKTKERILPYGIIFVDDTKVIERLSTQIDQDIKFVNVNNWTVYEHYIINDRKTMRQLGAFDSNFYYISNSNSSFEERRSNFQGYVVKAMTAHEKPLVVVDISSATLDIKSQTYDVTKFMTGVYADILQDMQKYANFTTTLHQRKDLKWGSITPLDNGTMVPEGIFESVTSGFAEMIVTE